jgi:hypothetical protein
MTYRDEFHFLIMTSRSITMEKRFMDAEIISKYLSPIGHYIAFKQNRDAYLNLFNSNIKAYSKLFLTMQKRNHKITNQIPSLT